MDVSEKLHELISQYIKNKNNPEQYRKLAEQLEMLPIFFNWEGLIGIRADQSFIYYDEATESSRAEKNRAWQITALADGSKKYKILKQLLPARTDDAGDCPECAASGHLVVNGKVNDKVICGQCFGLGWTNSEIAKLHL